MTKDYEVGYGRPPKHSQFKKGGPSPNPKGRPKGSHNLKTVLEQCLLAPTTIRDNATGKLVRMPVAEAFVKKLISDISKDNMRATRILADLIVSVADKPSAPANDTGPAEGSLAAEDEEIIRDWLKRINAAKGGGDE